MKSAPTISSPLLPPLLLPLLPDPNLRDLDRQLLALMAVHRADFLNRDRGGAKIFHGKAGQRSGRRFPQLRHPKLRWLIDSDVFGPSQNIFVIDSLGMQDSWSPLKVLAVASFANLSGDIFFCSVLGYGIAGAAWTTMFSQYIGGYLMLRSLNRKGYNALTLSIPSSKEFAHMIELAAPVLLTMLSKVSFYSFITYLSTSLGAVTLAAHQVMIGIYSTCTVSGEPLCQTAQSFMPALIQGTNQNLSKARSLLKSLLLIGAVCGVFLGCVAICFPWVFPQVFTRDGAVISQMRAVTVPFLWSLVMTPPLLSLEGTLLAGRDLKFLSLSMVSCFLGGSALLMVLKTQGFGLQSFWWVLASFQSARFVMAFIRLHSAKSVLRDPQTVAKQSSPHLKHT